jgi:hypothetical protein
VLKDLHLWQIVTANVLVLAVFLWMRRWSRGLYLGMVGLALVILPAAFAYFTGRITALEAAAPVAGVIIVGADVAGKLGLRRR